MTPEDQSFMLYEAAGPPKKLMLLKGTTHYGVYNDYFLEISAAVVDWYDRYLKNDKIEVRETT